MGRESLQEKTFGIRLRDENLGMGCDFDLVMIISKNSEKFQNLNHLFLII